MANGDNSDTAPILGDTYVDRGYTGPGVLADAGASAPFPGGPDTGVPTGDTAGWAGSTQSAAPNGASPTTAPLGDTWTEPTSWPTGMDTEVTGPTVATSQTGSSYGGDFGGGGPGGGGGGLPPGALSTPMTPMGPGGLGGDTTGGGQCAPIMFTPMASGVQLSTTNPSMIVASAASIGLGLQEKIANLIRKIRRWSLTGAPTGGQSGSETFMWRALQHLYSAMKLYYECKDPEGIEIQGMLADAYFDLAMYLGPDQQEAWIVAAAVLRPGWIRKNAEAAGLVKENLDDEQKASAAHGFGEAAADAGGRSRTGGAGEASAGGDQEASNAGAILRAARRLGWLHEHPVYLDDTCWNLQQWLNYKRELVRAQNELERERFFSRFPKPGSPEYDKEKQEWEAADNAMEKQRQYRLRALSVEARNKWIECNERLKKRGRPSIPGPPK